MMVIKTFIVWISVIGGLDKLEVGAIKPEFNLEYIDFLSKWTESEFSIVQSSQPVIMATSFYSYVRDTAFKSDKRAGC